MIDLMTLITPDEDRGNSAELLGIAEKHFERLAGALDRAVVAVEQGQPETAKEANGLVRDLSKSLQSVMEERVRVEKLRRQNAGIVHDFAIDFDSARSEIRGRLARLRATVGAGGVSE
ncbi:MULTISPECIES: hypothetical protein [Halocynthiibacter]|uniref:Uncharacterized protein n=1 Tax=Halocynthiibacter halioticoli TaxID=2986804 RepID=A0AAE3LSW5_9RHOB|nr:MULTISPECIES: hypothetical protein [Halocynthiibacter]MCV6824081.1 hypothetical protein [Halocynthiibacter halioticoli]MCW4057082.1 hypothetical protein [Halocynthiibacter sp. SDUM655004]MDE0589889.1 hypothetical protein [Halocynthiibacter sp. C4]